MDLQEAYAMQNLTKQEIGSVKRYLGYSHTGINLLSDFDPKIYDSLRSEGWLLPENAEDVKHNIEDFVNIYSAMYKESSYRIKPHNLVRGTSNKRVHEMNGSVPQFLSTSTDENIAKTFTKYGDGALVYFSIDGDVPFLYTSPFLNEYSKDEHEVLLAPFCEAKITYENHSNNTYGFSSYGVTVTKSPLEKVDEEELKNLQEEVINRFSQNMAEIRQLLDLEVQLNSLDRYYYQSEGNPQEQADILEARKTAQDKYNVFKSSTSDYKNKLQRLLKGLCKEKELEIDQAKEMVNEDRQRKKEEQEKRKTDEERKNLISNISKRFSQNPSISAKLQSNIETSYKRLVDLQNNMNSMAHAFGIHLNMESPACIEELIGIIKQNIQTISDKISNLPLNENTSLEDAKQISSDFTPLLDGLNYGLDTSSIFPDIEDLYNQQLNDSFKQKLYYRVQQVLQNARLQKYTQEKFELQNEHIGFIGKLLGKEYLMEERLKNVNLKIQLAKSPIPELQDEPHVRDMLADIYICANKDLDGNFTEEMKSLYDTMSFAFVSTKKGKFTEEYIQDIANKKMQREAEQSSNLPTVSGKVPGFFGKRKAQITALRNENFVIQSKLSARQATDNNPSFKKYSPDQDAFTILKKRLKSIISHTAPEIDTRSKEDLEITAEVL